MTLPRTCCTVAAMRKKNPHFSRFLADYMGGDRDLAARQLGVSLALIGHMSLGIRQVSVPVAQKIELATHGEITRYELRPDVYGAAPRRIA